MTDYTNRQFDMYIPDGDIEENVLQHHLVPSIILEVKAADNFLQSILMQSSAVLNQESSMERFQQKLCRVMSPLSIL